MAFKATLDLDGTEYEVESCSFGVSQDSDHRNNKPTSHVSPNPISLEVKVDGDKLKNLWIWAKEDQASKAGGIKFFKIDEDASMFEIKFEDAYCTNFHYSMSSHGGADMTVSFDVSYRVIELEGEDFEVMWT